MIVVWKNVDKHYQDDNGYIYVYSAQIQWFNPRETSSHRCSYFRFMNSVRPLIVIVWYRQNERSFDQEMLQNIITYMI